MKSQESSGVETKLCQPWLTEDISVSTNLEKNTSRLFQQRNFNSKQGAEQGMLLKLSCVILLIIQRDTESTHVIGGWRTVVQGEDVDLSCRLIETTEDLEQITWQKSTWEETQNHNFMLIDPNGVPTFISPNGLTGRVQFIGNPSENLGSIRITAVRLLDEGTFTCIFSVFPSGAYTTEIPLTVLVPPVVSVTVDVPPVIGKNEVVLATCVAAGAKPQADVKWQTGTIGSLMKIVTNSTQHANGTTTVLSHLLGVPTRAANQQQIQCVVNQSALATERSYNYTIDIHCKHCKYILLPLSYTIDIHCTFIFHYQCYRPWTSTVRIESHAEGDILHFLSLNSELNGLYVCEASNPHGRATGSLNVHISSETSAACWVLLVVILCLIVAAVALMLYRSPIIANNQFQAPPQVEEDEPGTSGF
ncbi:unnamed protein product [Oncorhynchus mykiss]|uniref:Ig-like domain-containing protein n=1 Tax=Oncorhynchus mykiss TaxID=8022 RepID=A0A060X7U4_ONCMY|nr:unnamed protein product [Oncorhynchus mykiss]